MRGPALGIVFVAACWSGTSATDPDAASPAPGAAVDAPDTIGAWTSTPPCSATDIYTTPALAPLTAADRGAIVGCTLGQVLDLAATQAKVGALGITATTGVRVVKLAFRTVRSDGTETVSTASAYLPLVPRALPAPLILVGRSTSGLADSCAPSRGELPQDNYALPLAAHGYVTITPDFAGLGNEGVHAYLDNHEAATQLFDAARAARRLVPGDVVSAPTAAIGYSQGGGTVLSAQALELQLTGDHSLRAVAAIAPEWPISTKSFDYEAVLRNPDGLTGFAGLSPPPVTVLRHYGFAANHMDSADATFPANQASSLISEINSLCTVELGGALDAHQAHLRDLVDATFRSQVLACIDGVPGCSGGGAEFHAWLTQDFVHADPHGARVLVAQGLADQVMPASKEAACVVGKLRAEGLDPTLCTDSTATHDTVVERRIADVIAWLEASIDGTVPPACASQTLPSCAR